MWMWLALSALASEPLLVDFGAEDGQVLDGFVAATPWTLHDPRMQWREQPARARDGDWPDPLAGDAVSGGRLHVDVEPGTWTLLALLDDSTWDLRPVPGSRSGLKINGVEQGVEVMPPGEDFFASRFYAANPRPHFTPDNSPWERQILPSLQWRQIQVEVPESGLDLEPFGAPWAALMLLPTDAATAEVEQALVDARRREAWLSRRPPFPSSTLPFSTEGLVGLQVMSWDGHPDAASALAVAKHHVALAPGQRTTLLLAIHGSDAPATFRLEGDLATLDPRLHEVHWLDIVERARLRARPEMLRPLGHDDPIEAGQGLVPMIALTLRAPQEAHGSMDGQLTIARDGIEVRLDLAVRIRDLVLEPAPTALGAWVDLRAPAAAIYGPDAPETQDIWSADVQVLRDHEVEVIGLRGTYYPGRLNQRNKPIPRERLQWAVEAWRSAGGGRVTWVDPLFSVTPPMGSDIDPIGLMPGVEAYMRDAIDVARELDIDLYVIDEQMQAYGPGAARGYVRFLDALNELDPDRTVRWAAATPHAGAFELAAPRVDLAFVNRMPHLDPERFAWWAGQRASVYAYNLGFQREASALYGWVLGADAMVIWHYDESYNDPFNDLRVRPQYQMAFLAPDGHSIWPGRRLTALAEGQQDQRYLATVAALVAELAPKRRLRADVDRACALLRAAHDGIAGRQPEDFQDLGLRDDSSLAALQDALGDVGEVLARRSKRQRTLRAQGSALVPDVRGVPAACGPTTPRLWEP